MFIVVLFCAKYLTGILELIISATLRGGLAFLLQKAGFFGFVQSFTEESFRTELKPG